MADVIDKITPYSFEFVNCFERPIAIVLENQKSGLGSLFLMYNGLAMSYYDQQYIHHNGFFYSSVNKEIKIDIKKIQIENNDTERIAEVLQKYKYVFVPGNLKMLYYSEYYQQSDWKHLFLITGYDHVSHLFHVLDNEQQSYTDENIFYTKFVIPSSIMQEVFQSYLWKEHNAVYVLEIPKELNITEHILNFLNIVISKIDSKEYAQDNLISIVQREAESETVMELYKLQLLSIKYKYVMFCELINLLNNEEIDVAKLKYLNDELYRIWNISILSFIKRIIRKPHDKSSYNRKEIDVAEFNIQNELVRIYKLLNSKVKRQKSYSKEKYSLLNNEDKIISLKDNKICFTFKTGKIYNSWKTDLCPKIRLLLGKEADNIESFRIQSGIVDHKRVNGFQYGIYIKTESENTYVFGYDYFNGAVIDQFGVGNLKHITLNDEFKRLSLSIQKKGDEFRFVACSELEIVDVGDLKPDSKIIECGIYCKTWDLCYELEVEFWDLRLNNKGMGRL